MIRDDIVTEGYNAAFKGQSRCKNPYDELDEFHEMWNEGFDLAVSEVGFSPWDIEDWD